MAQNRPYTGEELIQNLDSIKRDLDSLAQGLLGVSKENGPENDSVGERCAAYSGLSNQLGRLSQTIGKCLSTLRERVPSTEARGVTLDEEPPILITCRNMADNITNCNVNPLSVDTALRAKAEALLVQMALSNAFSWTNSRDGFIYYLSLLPKHLPLDSQALELPVSEMRRWRSGSTAESSAQPSTETLLYWMLLLNAAFNNREPQGFHRETLFLGLRNLTTPEYSEAATRWPLYASQNWTVVGPEAVSLFSTERRFNFVQWALEYARNTWPGSFGAESSTSDPLIKLTEALCSGSLTPLHIAAALGLPNLCRHLISSGSSVNVIGPLMTPLVWALLGREALLAAFTFEYWTIPSDPITYANKERIETIRLLVDENATCNIEFDLGGDAPTSLAAPAFWASMAIGDDSIFPMLIDKGAVADLSMPEMFQPPDEGKRDEGWRRTMGRMMTRTIDLFIRHYIDAYDYDDLWDNMKIAMESLMGNEDVDFVAYERSDIAGSYRGREPGDYLGSTVTFLTIEAARQDIPLLMRRLCLDPRFDPDTMVEPSNGSGTILHTAVSNDYHEIVDILLKAGADMQQRDNQGRTPVMVVETRRMLGTLVLLYGASTLDKDTMGRNIWHLFVETGDYSLLSWLCANDDRKDQCLRAVDNWGCTPLSRAFLAVKGLADLAMGTATNANKIVKMVLMECSDKAHQVSPTPLPHLAVEWGDLELVEALVARGADFSQQDELLRVPLHYINFSASEALVRRLRQLCPGATVNVSYGAALIIFRNLRPFKLHNHPSRIIPYDEVMNESTKKGTIKLSMHPSCSRPLCEKTYGLLLDDVVERARVRPHWGHFCSEIVVSSLRTTHQQHALDTVMRESVAAALKCAIRAGLLWDYEKRYGVSGIYGLLMLPTCVEDIPKGNSLPWLMPPVNPATENLGTRHVHRQISAGLRAKVALASEYMQTMLESSAREHADAFYRSGYGADILCQAAILCKMDLVTYLCRHGVSVFGQAFRHGTNRMLSTLEQVLMYCENTRPLEELLRYTLPEDLNRRQNRIINALRGKHPPESSLKTGLLLIRGINPHLRPGGRGTQSMTERGIINKHSAEMAITMVEQGMDLQGGPNGHNAIFAAVVAGHDWLLEPMISMAGPRFPWTAQRETDGRALENLVFTAVEHDRDECLEALLGESSVTGLKDHMDDLVNGTTAAHKAVRMRRNRVLDVLGRHGADFSARDAGGGTPAHLACSLSAELGTSAMDSIRILMRYSREILDEKDADGWTPLDIAKQRMDGALDIAKQKMYRAMVSFLETCDLRLEPAETCDMQDVDI